MFNKVSSVDDEWEWKGMLQFAVLCIHIHMYIANTGET